MISKTTASIHNPLDSPIVGNTGKISTERNLAFKTDTFIVEGRIDRLDEEDSGVAVVDYKTGKSAPSPDEVRGSLALAMYALMVQRTLNRSCFDVSLHHIPSNTQVSWRHTPATLERHLERVAGIAADITRAQDTWESTDQSDEIREHCLFLEVCSESDTEPAVRTESGEGSGRGLLLIEELTHDWGFRRNDTHLCVWAEISAR